MRKKFKKWNVTNNAAAVELGRRWRFLIRILHKCTCEPRAGSFTYRAQKWPLQTCLFGKHTRQKGPWAVEMSWHLNQGLLFCSSIRFNDISKADADAFTATALSTQGFGARTSPARSHPQRWAAYLSDYVMVINRWEALSRRKSENASRRVHTAYGTRYLYLCLIQYN